LVVLYEVRTKFKIFAFTIYMVLYFTSISPLSRQV